MMMIYSQHQTGTCLYLKTSFLYSNNNNNNFWKSEFYVARMMTREKKIKFCEMNCDCEGGKDGINTISFDICSFS